MAPSPTYDAKGNTLTLPRANGTSQSLTWDAHNRLRSVTPSGSAARTMVYDPLGRLVWSRRPDGANPAIDEVWSWSSWTLLAREIYQGITALETYRYTWGPDLSGTLEGAGGVGGLLAEERAVGSSTVRDIRHTHADANGNILALTNATGQVSARYRYSPFGETLSNQDLDGSGWATKNIHRFSTKPEIAGTGLLYYGYRYYDPQTGRWPTRDPIEEEGGLNLYGFVGNDGVVKFDYLGNRGYSVCSYEQTEAGGRSSSIAECDYGGMSACFDAKLGAGHGGTISAGVGGLMGGLIRGPFGGAAGGVGGAYMAAAFECTKYKCCFK